jgi:hypothetical protein
MEEPFHGRSFWTPTVVPPSQSVPTHDTKQRHTQHDVPKPPQPSPVSTQGIGRTFSFDATPMALLGTEVLVHQKPNRRKNWGNHAAKAWYLSHAPSHYRCMHVIMKDMGGEHITDMFRQQHHAIPVPAIMATNHILKAMRHLAYAIKRVQEAPLDKMAAIQSPQALLLGKEILHEPEPITQPRRPKAPLTVSPTAKMENGDPPIRM